MAQQTPDSLQINLLQQVLEQLKHLNETLDNFTNDGFPLQHSVPTGDLLAVYLVAASLLSRENPRLNAEDLQKRIQSATIIAQQLVAVADHALRQSRAQRLERLNRS